MRFSEFFRRNLWRLFYHSGLAGTLSDRVYTELLYWAHTGRFLNLNAPVDFNQKEQWLKLYYKNPLYITCADKYEAREYVKKTIGEKYLNTCIGVYSRVEDIDFALLPDRFVLKATHGSGWNLVCHNKASLEWRSACRKMKRWLHSDFSRVGREWQYKNIKPRIICEAFLEEDGGASLVDYKLFTFRGVTKYVAVEFDKVDGRHYINFYDANWRFQPEKHLASDNDATAFQAPPECFEEMKNLAYRLASDFPMCRVDFYALGGKKIIFGELTFSPGKGCNALHPQSFCDELGGYIELPQIIAK